MVQLSADYSIPHLTLKSAVGLTSQPKVDLAATTGYKDIVIGGEATYDSAKGDVTKWSAGAGEFALHRHLHCLSSFQHTVDIRYADICDSRTHLSSVDQSPFLAISILWVFCDMTILKSILDKP